MRDDTKVVLSWRELQLAAMVGVMRQVENLQKQRVDKHKADPAREWQTHLDGAIGEAAVAKWLDRYWNGNLGNLDADDVGKFQVRYTYRDDGRLILHKEDGDDKVFILVTGIQPVLRLRGWIRGRDGKLPQYWTDPKTGRPAFFVPQSALKPMRRKEDKG